MTVISLDKLTDDVTECRQWQVNLGCLLESITSCLRFTLPLGAGQIDQVQLACLNALLTLFIFFSSFNIYCKNRMAPGTVLIHCCLARFTVTVTLLHELLDLWYRLDDACRKVLHVHALVLALLEVQFAIHCFGQQIANLLVINFQVWASDQKLFTDVICIIKVPKNVVERVRNDATLRIVALDTDHCVRLTTSRLPVRENRTIVAWHDGFN